MGRRKHDTVMVLKPSATPLGAASVASECVSAEEYLRQVSSIHVS